MKGFEKIVFNVAKFLLHKLGFEFVALRSKDGNVLVEGDTKLIRYTDYDGYLWGKEQLKRLSTKTNGWAEHSVYR